nr:hypothetical protein [Hydrogenibacillus schlegelii]
MSEGNKDQRHLPDIHFAVFEAVTDPFQPCDLRVHAFGVAIRRPLGKAGSPYAGQILDKIGRTTGWTYGKVTGTCVDVNQAGSDITLLGQDIVAAGSGGGDSGSPVFYWHGGNEVILYGLLWGGSSDLFVFSNMYNIEKELGNLGVR